MLSLWSGHAHVVALRNLIINFRTRNDVTFSILPPFLKEFTNIVGGGTSF